MHRPGSYRRLRRRGFTLIETLVVVMYIAIIAGMVVPNVTGAGRRATEAHLRATLREMRTGVASFQAETGVYPLQLVDITSRTAPATGLTASGLEVPIYEKDFHGPYLLVPGGGLPRDRSTNDTQWAYSTTPPTVGAVHSLSTGSTPEGEPYSTF